MAQICVHIPVEGVNAFLDQSLKKGTPHMGFIAFLLSCFWKICLGVLCHSPSTLHPPYPPMCMKKLLKSRRGAAGGGRHTTLDFLHFYHRVSGKFALGSHVIQPYPLTPLTPLIPSPLCEPIKKTAYFLLIHCVGTQNPFHS